MTDRFISIVKTVDDRSQMESDLAVLKQAVYVAGEFDKLLESGVSQSLADFIMSDLAGKKPSEDYLLGLEKGLDSLGVVSVNIAFDPTQKNVDEFYSWVAKNVGHHLVLDINVDKSLLGGAQIEYRGKYLDETIAHKLAKH